MIEVKNIVKRFDGFAALDGATLSVPTGSVYGLVGPNGAGKSTLIRHLTGICRQDEGTISIAGEPVWENSALKARVAAIPDDWYYFLQSSVRDMMRFYRGFYHAFSMERYEKLKGIFRSTRSGPSAACPRECRSRAPSGWPCAAIPSCWYWMSRWTALTR